MAATTRRRLQRVYRMTLTSDPKNIHRVEQFLLDVDSAVKIGEEKLSTLLVVLTEAVNNAIIHGNKRDRTKRVVVSCRLQGDELVTTVKDEGGGFDPDALPDPVHKDNLLRESGRGVFLIRQMMESVRYNAKGNEVTMRMKIR